MSQPEPDDDRFEVICRHKDTHPSNLNERFQSYGTETLEAKVPILYSEEKVEKLLTDDPKERLFTSLAYKAKAGAQAVEGRRPRTRNRDLKLIEIGNEKVLAAGETRERSPVDIDELDEELEEYVIERERMRALREGREPPPPPVKRFSTKTTSSSSSTSKKPTEVKTKKDSFNWKEVPSEECLDDDLDNYMREANRIKKQKELLVGHTDQAAIMMEMEEDFDNDKFDENDDL